MNTKHIDNRFSVTAHSLARATLKIAASNHYMVGFDSSTTEGISFDDFTDAHTILVDIENADPKHQHRYDLAFMVLSALCQQQHRTGL